MKVVYFHNSNTTITICTRQSNMFTNQAGKARNNTCAAENLLQGEKNLGRPASLPLPQACTIINLQIFNFQIPRD